MKSSSCFILFLPLLVCASVRAQVGVNSQSPKVSLHIESITAEALLVSR